MSEGEVHSNIWRNTISNYVCVVVRLIMGLFMFRLLWQLLGKEELGFWGLLWSVFGYGVLLDFGLGFTAQKRVAELSVHRNWDELSRVLSTIFFSYVGIGALLICVGVGGSELWIDIFNISPRNREPFRELLVYFFWGLGLAFPLGLFPEMLRGLQRISQANYILLAGMITNFALGSLCLHLNWGLKTLLIIALGCTFIPDLVCGLVVKRRLPQVRIHPRFFSKKMIRQTVSFSVYAYIITVSNIILTKTDHLVLSSTLTVSAVAIYLAGSKVGEMFYAFTQQLPDTLSPAAAHLHAQGSRNVLQELLVDGTRFTLMISTPLYCIFALFMESIVRLLTGDEQVSREIFWVGQILLFWIYNLVVTQSVSKRIFMMCGHEKRLMWLGVGEALLNLALSVSLVLYFRQVWCVALGSLVATAFFGWVFLWPWSAREANLSGWKLARTVLFPTWLACLPLLVLVALQHAVPLLDGRGSTFVFLIQGLSALLAAALGVWWLGLRLSEREKLAAYAGKYFTRRTAA